MKNKNQSGLSDYTEWMTRLELLKDPLVSIGRSIDFESFRGMVENSTLKEIYFKVFLIFRIKIALVLWCIFVNINIIFSQHQMGFNESFDYGANLEFYHIHYDTTDNTILTIGLYYNDDSNTQNIFVAIIDTHGNVLDTFEIVDPMESSNLTMEYLTGIESAFGYKAVFPFIYFNRSTLGLALIDSLGTVEVKEYHLGIGSNTIPKDIVAVSDGFLIAGGYSSQDIYAEAFLMKVDRNGEFLWMKEYGDAKKLEVGVSICKISSNYYLLGGTQNHYVHPDYFLKSFAIAIDSTGNQLWDWTGENNAPGSSGIIDFQYNAESEELFYLSYDSRPTTYPNENYTVSVPLIVHCDTTMNIKSVQQIGNYAFGNYLWGIEKSINGDWLAFGRSSRATDSVLVEINSLSGKVVRMNNEAEILWSRLDTAFFTEEYGSFSNLYGLAESPNGFIYAVGSAKNRNSDNILRSYGWLLKISPDGCMEELCDLTSIIENNVDDRNSIKMFPNPARNYLTIVSKSGSLENTKLLLYDLVGQVVFEKYLYQSEIEITLPSLLSGLYFYSVLDKTNREITNGKLLIDNEP